MGLKPVHFVRFNSTPLAVRSLTICHHAFCENAEGAAAFGVTETQTNAAVKWSSVWSGDNNPGGTRIVFVNGDLDPFHVGGVTANTSKLLAQDVVALVVRDGSHCQDMGGTNTKHDSASMSEVKATKAAFVRKWLAE
jgi:hypothetical protein